MFDFIRDHKKIMQILLIILIFPSFVLFGMDGYKRFQSNGDVVATVNGVEITKEEWEQSHKDEVTRMRAAMPNIDVAMFDSPAMKYGVLERMVQTRVLESSAKTLNLKVSDQRIALAISGIEGLAGIKKPDGSLDIEKYKQLLASQGMTPEIFENRMRGEVAMRQVVNGVTQSSVTFPAQIDVALDSFYQQREIQIAIFSASDFLAQAKPSDDDVNKFFATHKNEYQSAESADIEYVVLSLDAIEKSITLNEADLKAYFEQNQASLAAKEERRASHILINASDSASDANKQKAREKAQSILEAIKKNPASFADSAKKNSQDPGSAVKGGDLGFFARGAMVKPFEDAAYALNKGEISGLVQSDFGFHIIQLTDIKSATSDFNQSRPVLEKELKNQQARRKKQTDQSGVGPKGVPKKNAPTDKNVAPTNDQLKLIQKSVYGQESGSGTADTSKPNYAGAIGPMQILPKTFDWVKQLGKIPKDYDINNPEHNKAAGDALLGHYHDKYKGDPKKVYAAYYGGPSAVNKDGSINTHWRDKKNPKAPTVGQYIQQVLGRMEK